MQPSREDAGRLDAALLFHRYFLPLYPPDARASLAAARATDANPGQNPGIYASLDDTARTFAHLAPRALGDDALALDLTDVSVHRLAARITRARRDAWIREDADGAPLLVRLVTHGALYVGACVVKSHGGVWQVRRPLWESQVRLESRRGVADLAPFHWWLKALSDDEVDSPRLADRYRQHVELPTLDPDEMVVFAPGERAIPRLSRVRYDTLYKHLRAHLPELKSVGDDFPSPERLDEMSFKWLDFKLLGHGRMLLMHGPGASGVHLFWLDASGFSQAAFYPADAFPAHKVEVEGDILAVVVSVGGKVIRHEMLWWGA